MSTFTLASPPTTAPTSPSDPSPDFSDSEEDNLPYPPDLPRTSFLPPQFTNPQTYLSTLGTRHQTLEDLRAHLRTRHQFLSGELLSCVNAHYSDFLALGTDLKGGGEKVEGVRVGVEALRREVRGVLEGVRGWEREMGELVKERRRVWRERDMGRGLLEVGEGLERLEGELGISVTDDEEGEEEEEDEDEDGGEDEDEMKTTMALRRLEGHVDQFILLTRAIERFGPEHPFLKALRPRVQTVRRTLLLDLGGDLRRARKEGEKDLIWSVLRLYEELGAEEDGLKVLRGS